MLAYQNERMPEQIRLKVGSVGGSRFAVYDEFARNVPGFQPMSDREAALYIPKVNLPVDALPVQSFNGGGASQNTNHFANEEFIPLYEELCSKMEAFITGVGLGAHSTLQVSRSNFF